MGCRPALWLRTPFLASWVAISSWKAKRSYRLLIDLGQEVFKFPWLPAGMTQSSGNPNDDNGSLWACLPNRCPVFVEFYEHPQCRQ